MLALSIPPSDIVLLGSEYLRNLLIAIQ